MACKLSRCRRTVVRFGTSTGGSPRYGRVLILPYLCDLILLYLCPHSATYVSSYYCIYVDTCCCSCLCLSCCFELLPKPLPSHSESHSKLPQATRQTLESPPTSRFLLTCLTEILTCLTPMSSLATRIYVCIYVCTYEYTHTHTYTHKIYVYISISSESLHQDLFVSNFSAASLQHLVSASLCRYSQYL